MKTITLIVTFMIFVLLPVKGQLRHVKGINNIGITYGRTDGSDLFGVGYSHYFQPKWIWNINTLYETGKVQSTKFKNFIINGGVDYTCFKLNNFFFFNTGFSLFTGFEKLSSNETTEDTTNFTFGPSGNVNVELYLTSRILFQVKAEQYYSPLSDLGKWFPVYSLCLKFSIF